LARRLHSSAFGSLNNTMTKVIRLPRQSEFDSTDAEGLQSIARDLEQLAESLQRHARNLRRHAALLDRAALKDAQPIRARRGPSR